MAVIKSKNGILNAIRRLAPSECFEKRSSSAQLIGAVALRVSPTFSKAAAMSAAHSLKER
jgi:hypothetical protein